MSAIAGRSLTITDSEASGVTFETRKPTDPVEVVLRLCPLNSGETVWLTEEDIAALYDFLSES